MDFGGDDDRSVMAAVASPLVDGLMLFDKAQLELELFKVKIDAYAAKTDIAAILVDNYHHTLDAANPEMFPDPPLIPPGLTPEQHAAHLAIYDLVSVAEFEQERCKPGFFPVNQYWGVNGKRRFCCEAPTKPTLLGQRAYIDGMVYHKSVHRNEEWMTAFETALAPAAQMKKQPWWDRFFGWLCDRVF